MMEGNTLKLSEFGEYILKKHLVPENKAQYYVGWVRKFLHEPVSSAVSFDDRLAAFQELLESRGSPDWQVEQAEHAIRMYFNTFLNGTQLDLKPDPVIIPAKDGTVDKLEVMGATRTRLRVKHYSYRTEQTYLEWLTRFFSYLSSIGCVHAGNRFIITPQSVKDFITYLATQRHVSASTQNQAFNALVFLCREVLRIPSENLDTGVRAKKRFNLPVVLSSDEVASLLAHMEGTTKLMAELIYGGGLRVMECCRLRVKDIDFDRVKDSAAYAACLTRL
jgi:hypothetical protein